MLGCREDMSDKREHQTIFKKSKSGKEITANDTSILLQSSKNVLNHLTQEHANNKHMENIFLDISSERYNAVTVTS